MSHTTKKFHGLLKETSYKSQAVDAFPRHSKAYGQCYKSGVLCWTNIKAYCQYPTLDHPLTIKLGMYNPEGKAFVQMPVHEFDELLADLITWREANKEVIDELIAQNEILVRNKAKRDFVESILSKTDFSDPPEIIIDGVNVTQKSISREKEMVIRMLKQLPNSSNKSFLIKDICSRIDELNAQKIDLSDIADDLEVLTKEQLALQKQEKGGILDGIDDLFPNFYSE